MKVFYGTEKLPELKRPILTIGTFDGVHEGHRNILQSVVKEARALQGTSILITFDPHPRKLVHPDEPLKLLSTLDERLALVAGVGIDIVVVVPFTAEFAALSARAYVEQFLIGVFRPEAIVIGYDHHFGHDRTGDIELLREYAAAGHFSVREIAAHLIADAAVSSTQVRKALNEGAVDRAARMLGTPYCLGGKVGYGAQRGRTIGFPTANLISPVDKLVPKPGVYAVWVNIGAERFRGMLNIGFNPTVSSDNLIKMEVHLLDFDRDIYNESISVCFVARIRDERKFAGLDELKAQLARDRQDALRLLP